MPTPVASQPGEELSTGNTPTSDLSLEQLLVLALGLLLIVKEIKETATQRGILGALKKYTESQDNLRAAEIRYENSGMQTQAFVKTIDHSLKAIEHILLTYAPDWSVTKAVDMTEDFTDEITDGKPVDLKKVDAEGFKPTKDVSD